MPRRLGILSTLALLSACEGGTHLNSINDDGDAGCTISITGSVTASGSCTAAVTYSFAANQTLFTVSLPSAVGSVNALTVTMVLKAGIPTTGTFTEVTSVSTEMDVTSGALAWLTTRNIPGITTQGTASITIASLGTEHVSSDANRSYTTTQAVFDATAPYRQGTNTTGSVSVHILF